MWEENVYEIGERSYDDLSVQANEAVSKAGLYAGLFAGGVALTSAYYVNAKSPLYNPDITEYNRKKQEKKTKREQAVEEAVQRSNNEKASTQTRSAEELAILREEQKAKNREREEALNQRRAEREAQADAPSEPVEKKPPTQADVDQARAEAASTRQNLDNAHEKLEAAKHETVGSRVDRHAKKDNLLRKALNTVKRL